MNLGRESWLRTVIVALGFALIGVGLLWFADTHAGYWYTSLASNVGSVLVASVALVVIFDLWQKGALLDEIFRTINSASELKLSGIVGYKAAFQEVGWDDLFKSSSHLDIVFAYGATWRNTHEYQLKRMLKRPDGRLRLLLPDPDQLVVIEEMAVRFDTTADDLRKKISDAIVFYAGLAKEFPGKVSVYVMANAMTYSAYRFTENAVVALYTHRKGRHTVPAFVCKRGGEMYEWVRKEWEDITNAGLAEGICRKVEQ